MINKHPHEAEELMRVASDGAAKIKALHSTRPTQPLAVQDQANLVALKLHAAAAHERFVELMVTVAEATGATVTPAVSLKKSFRILQKLWIRGELVSICDVVRSLIEVADFPGMLAVHKFLIDWDLIELVDLKNRLSYPTSGGWADLVYLFRLRGGNGHICEVQLALRPMMVARLV